MYLAIIALLYAAVMAYSELNLSYNISVSAIIKVMFVSLHILCRCDKYLYVLVIFVYQEVAETKKAIYYLTFGDKL